MKMDVPRRGFLWGSFAALCAPWGWLKGKQASAASSRRPCQPDTQSDPPPGFKVYIPPLCLPLSKEDCLVVAYCAALEIATRENLPFDTISSDASIGDKPLGTMARLSQRRQKYIHDKNQRIHRRMLKELNSIRRGGPVVMMPPLSSKSIAESGDPMGVVRASYSCDLHLQQQLFRQARSDGEFYYLGGERTLQIGEFRSNLFNDDVQWPYPLVTSSHPLEIQQMRGMALEHLDQIPKAHPKNLALKKYCGWFKKAVEGIQSRRSIFVDHEVGHLPYSQGCRLC